MSEHIELGAILLASMYAVVTIYLEVMAIREWLSSYDKTEKMESARMILLVWLWPLLIPGFLLAYLFLIVRDALGKGKK